MAKFRHGAALAEITGSIGGWTFSHSRYGAYIRMRQIPTKRDTPYTEIARNALIASSKAWAGLTAAVKAAWVTWAQTHPITDAIGNPQVLTGHTAYIAITALQRQLGDTPVLNPPLTASPAPVTIQSLSAYADHQTVTLEFTPDPLPANTGLYIQAVLSDNPTRTFFTNLVKLVTVSIAATPSPLALQDDILERFGSLLTGQLLLLRIKPYNHDTGLLGPPVTISTIVQNSTPP
jgi:hypothetical protein